MKRSRWLLARFSGVIAMSNPLKPPAYIAYIDESGDDGLNTVRPIDPNGSAEWLMMAAVLIDAKRVSESAIWASDILAEARKTQPQLSGLHFKNLTIENGRKACSMLAQLPVRCFVVASNKKNMRRYENPFAGQIPSKNWFYCWLTRLLLERVTYFASQKARSDYGESRPLSLVFSERGRFSYAQIMAYYEWLRMRCSAGKNCLPLGEISWDVMRREHFEVRRNELSPGLQLSDIVASAFFRASDIHQTSQHDPQCAKLLSSRMARDPDNANGKLHGFGVKLMPAFNKAALSPAQVHIYRHYGYPYPQWWMPK